MSFGFDNVMQVWNDLQRIEDELRWGGRFPGASGQQYDSMGRLATSSSDLTNGWIREQLGRTERLRKALRDSGPLARQMVIQTFAGIEISTVANILIAACEDVALYYGGSVIGGGLIGGIGGAFLGGVGAIPGAAAGMAAGAYVGGWVLAILGLKSLVEGLADSIPEALGFYANGFNEAWGPARQDPRYDIISRPGGNTGAAAFDLANGHVILVGAILSAMVAYLTKGKGNKTALLQEISQSRRLGPKFARWFEENEERLRRHPALQSRSRGAQGRGAAPSKKPPRESKDERPSQPKGMPQKRVPCFKTNGLPQGHVPEFDRQLAGQEAGINDMTVDEYLAGRDAFDAKQAARDPRVARQARAEYQGELERSLTSRYRSEGLSRQAAEAKALADAAFKMKTLAALHNPDMVAAGKDVISDFGDRNINSRIGAQWRKSNRLAELDEAARAAAKYVSGLAKMNAKLERCR